MTVFRAVALGLALALAGCLGQDSPEEQLAAIQEYQSKNLPLTAEQKSSVEASIAMGREAMAAGDGEQAGQAFEAALAVYKKAEDSALYNKAD